MARTRTNNKTEKLVFSYLRKENIYFKKHYDKAPGKPDIALPRKKKAVFIDGDFWHGRTLDKVIARRGNDDFWTRKLKRNIERDREQAKLLLEHDWSFIRIWVSDILRKSTRDEELNKIKSFLLS